MESITLKRMDLTTKMVKNVKMYFKIHKIQQLVADWYCEVQSSKCIKVRKYLYSIYSSHKVEFLIRH